MPAGSRRWSQSCMSVRMANGVNRARRCRIMVCDSCWPTKLAHHGSVPYLSLFCTCHVDMNSMRSLFKRKCSALLRPHARPTFPAVGSYVSPFHPINTSSVRPSSPAAVAMRLNFSVLSLGCNKENAKSHFAYQLRR